MANIPTSAEMVGDTVTEGQFKAKMTQLLTAVSDVQTESQAFTLSQGVSLEANKLQNPTKFSVNQVNFTQMPTSTTGTALVQFRNGLKQLKLSSVTTGGSLIAYWDFPASSFTRDFSASVTLEGLTAGSNGLVGIQQLNSSGAIISSSYAATSITAAETKKTYNAYAASVTATATIIRLIVNLMTTTTREVHVSNPSITDGVYQGFVAPVIQPTIPDISNLQSSVDFLNLAFSASSGKNKFNPALSENGKLVSFQTGQTVTYAEAISTGKHPVVAGNNYVFWIPTSSVFAFQTIIYTYSSDGTFLGLDHSIPSSGEIVNPNPPTGIAYSDSNKTVKFTIPSGSAIAYIQLMTVYRTHTVDEFNSLISGMQLELGTAKTSFEPYNPNTAIPILKPESLPSSLPTSTVIDNTFTVTTDGVYAYVRTPFSDSLDLVQQISYGANSLWSNNVVNPWAAKTIPKSTAKDGVITAFGSGTLLVTQGDDATPLNYNGTYIGANHGAYIVHAATVAGHGKTFVDVGSRWSEGSNIWTIVRIVNANTLWLVSQNTGSTYWTFNTTAGYLVGKTLTHSAGATNTASFAPTADVMTQLICAVNNHVRKLIADGFRELTTSGVYDVKDLSIINNYSIMNPVSILSYLQSHVGTASEQGLNVNSIGSDVDVAIEYKYAINGSFTVNTQLYFKSTLLFNFAGIVQAQNLIYTGKTLLQYVPKINPIVGPSKTWNFENVEDITTTIDSISFLSSSWKDANNPPDKIVQIVKNGSANEFGQILGYGLTRGLGLPANHAVSTDAGFVHTSRKMYPKTLSASAYSGGLVQPGSVKNAIAYRSIFNSLVIPSATVYTWYIDNGIIYVIFDTHQNASFLKLPLPAMFNGKSVSVVESNANFTLHSEIVTDNSVLVSVTNNYGRSILRLA